MPAAPASPAFPRPWDRHQILAEVRRQHLTMSTLARRHGMSASLFYIALDRPYPKIEKIIADAIGRSVEELWPDRVARRRLRAAA